MPIFCLRHYAHLAVAICMFSSVCVWITTAWCDTVYFLLVGLILAIADATSTADSPVKMPKRAASVLRRRSLRSSQSSWYKVAQRCALYMCRRVPSTFYTLFSPAHVRVCASGHTYISSLLVHALACYVCSSLPRRFRQFSMYPRGRAGALCMFAGGRADLRVDR